MLACESDGNPVMTEAPLGKGRVVFVSFPVELRTISTPGAFAAGAPAYWRIYRQVAAEALGRHGGADVETYGFRSNMQPSLLRGLDPAAIYEVTNYDARGSMKVSGGSTPLTTGSGLMGKGLTVEIKDKPGAVVITYRRQEESRT